MADSSIQWTDKTWNPVSGCTRASAGCDNCYAVTMTHRLEMMGQAKYAGLTVLNGKGDRHFNGVVRTHDDSLAIPLGWKKPKRIFVNSMSDLFHKDVPFAFIDKVFAVMALCPHHTFQILTKRADRMAEYFEGSAYEKRSRSVTLAIHEHSLKPTAPQKYRDISARVHYEQTWPLPNLWLGTSVEDQKAADERIPHLLKVPAAVRFLSCEPLLGAVDLIKAGAFVEDYEGDPSVAVRHFTHSNGIDWVIVGGESGGGARSFVLGWAKDIVRQCKAAGVPVFVKQIGALPTNREGVRHPTKDHKGGDMSEWPEEIRVREFPREAVKA